MPQEDANTDYILRIFGVYHHHLSRAKILSREEKGMVPDIHPILSNQMVLIVSHELFYLCGEVQKLYHTQYADGDGYLEMFSECRDD